QRLRDLHLARCPEAAGPRRDLCQMPLLSWSMASAWQATPDLRLLGTSASILRLGLVAPDGAGPASSRRSRDPLGFAAVPEDVAVVDACGGRDPGGPRLGYC